MRLMKFLERPASIEVESSASSSRRNSGDELRRNSTIKTPTSVSTPTTYNLNGFVDKRTLEMRKCFVDSGKSDGDGSDIFSAFLEKKLKHNSMLTVDFDSTVDWGIINGAHPSKLWWDMFIALMIVYSAVAVPYRLGFGLDSSGGFAIVDYAVDFFFFIDMAVSFNTSFSNGKEVVRSRKRIAKRYLKTWFLPDFISTVPFDTIVFLTVKSFSSDNLRTFKLVRVLRLFRLLKVFRIIRLNRKLQNAKAGGHINVFVYELLLVMTSVFFMAHFFSCIFYQFLDCEPDGTNFSSCGNKETYSQYLLSLSWSLQTILNIGYGNIVLTSIGGRVFSIFAMIGGAVIFGFVLAVMMQAASNKTPLEKEEQFNLALVGAYLNERNIKHNMKLSIWRHCRYYYAKKAEYDEPPTFQSAPVVLRRRFFDAMNCNVRNLHIWQSNFTILSRIQNYLHPLRVEPGASVVHQGDYCVDIFFVQKGCVRAFVHCARTKFNQTFVGEYPEGYEFGVACAMHVEDSSWATYRANDTSDLLWIDLTKLKLDADIIEVFQSRAMLEYNLHMTIEKLYPDIVLVEEEAGLYSTPSVIFKKGIVALDDIEGEVTDYKVLQSLDGHQDKVRMYKVFRKVNSNSKIHEIAMESTRDMLKRKVINPNSKFKNWFDGYIAICTILVIIILPLRMGFSIEPNIAWIIYDIIIEVSFIFDIVLSFFTAYEMSDLVLNTDRQHISARYLKGWFAVDVISGLPVTMLTLNEGFLLLRLFKFARIIRLVRVMRVFRITRLLKIFRISSSYEEKPFSTVEETYIKFIRLSMIALLFTHITACFWSKLAVDKMRSNTWEDAIDIEDASLWRRYLASFYFVYVTMNTTGYGDILAQNDVERFVLLFIIVMGSFLVAHVVAEISETNTGHACGTERLYLLRSYLRNKQIPETVQNAMLKQVAYANTMRTTYSETEIWEKLPFQLRVELAIVCHSAVIQQFPSVFDTSYPPIVFVLLNYFEPVHIVQGGYAFTFETGSGGIYLILSGVTEVVDEDRRGKELILGEHRAGHLFGIECIEDEILTFLGVRAKEPTNCYRFSASSVDIMYKEHPQIANSLFPKLKSRHKGSRESASVPLRKLPCTIEEQQPMSNKISKMFKTSMRRFFKEDTEIDAKTAYNRTGIDKGEWSPGLRHKLELYIEVNSPSLILSNESWKQFVASKDMGIKVEEEDFFDDIIGKDMVTDIEEEKSVDDLEQTSEVVDLVQSRETKILAVLDSFGEDPGGDEKCDRGVQLQNLSSQQNTGS